METMTRDDQSTASKSDHPVTLLLAFELGERTWKLGFTTGIGQRPRVRQLPAGAVDRVLEEIRRAKARLAVPADAPVVSCYEAGRDGFWLHRYLVTHDVTNYVVDSSSIEVPRRARRAKTDKLDLAGLLRLLARYETGDRAALAGGSRPECGGRGCASRRAELGDGAGGTDAGDQSAEGPVDDGGRAATVGRVVSGAAQDGAALGRHAAAAGVAGAAPAELGALGVLE